MSVLYIVPTPIGHLGDLSDRARQTLATVDFIAAEDTRVTVKLLNHLGLKKPMVSYYEHNRRESGERVAARIAGGETCALVTDAGTPAVSDPGTDLVALCAERGISVVALPGPCAAVTALSVSGLPCGRFCFEGFLSTGKKSRMAHLHALREEQRTMVFYEAPHKLAATLRDLLSVLGDRPLALCREMTKLHEEVRRTTLSEAIAHFEEVAPRGEFVLVVAGAPAPPPSEDTVEEAVALAMQHIEQGEATRDAVRKAVSATGARRNEVYAGVMTRMDNGRE